MNRYFTSLNATKARSCWKFFNQRSSTSPQLHLYYTKTILKLTMIGFIPTKQSISYRNFFEYREIYFDKIQAKLTQKMRKWEICIRKPTENFDLPISHSDPSPKQCKSRPCTLIYALASNKYLKNPNQILKNESPKHKFFFFSKNSYRENQETHTH